MVTVPRPLPYMPTTRAQLHALLDDILDTGNQRAANYVADILKRLSADSSVAKFMVAAGPLMSALATRLQSTDLPREVIDVEAREVPE